MRYIYWLVFYFSMTTAYIGIGESHFDIAPQVSVPITVEVKSKKSIHKSRFFIDDIADCSGYQPICDEVGGVDLGVSPEPGKRRVLKCADIKRRIREEFPHLSVVMDCPSFGVEVVVEGFIINEDQVENVLRENLESLASNNERFVIESIQLSSKRTRSKMGKLTVLGLNREVISKSKRSIGLELELVFLSNDDMKVEERIQIKVRLKKELKSFVFSQNFKRGTILTARHLEKIWIKPPTGFLDLFREEDILGQSLMRNVRKGDVVKRNLVKNRLLVRRGEIVALHIKSGNMQIKGRAKALSNGSLSETIQVRYLKSRKILSGRVSGENFVEVELE